MQNIFEIQLEMLKILSCMMKQLMFYDKRAIKIACPDNNEQRILQFSIEVSIPQKSFEFKRNGSRIVLF